MEAFIENTQIDYIRSDSGDIPVISPQKRMKFSDLLAQNRCDIFAALNEHGALLFRRFKLNSMGDFQSAVEALSPEDLLDYENRSTPRTQIANKVFTSTEYPAEAVIPSHNENSYSHCFPNYVYFFCVKSSEEGGQTPIVDNARVFEALNPDVVELFKRHGVAYVRNYGDVDLSWQEVFNTDSKQQVENYCVRNNIEFNWNSKGLQTRAVRPATLVHPYLKREIWFNQAHLFHYSNLGQSAQSLIDVYGIDGLPRNATLGDGSPIPEDALAHIRETIDQHQIIFDWQPSDLLLVDNLRMAHGRLPFKGSRKVLVMMSHAYSN